MHPEVVSQGEIRGVGDSVYVTLSQGARPRIVFGERPATGPHTLPSLGSEPVSPGLQVDSIRVFGVGGGLVALELQVSGDARGRLFLTGQPEVDPQTGIISVPDLRLDVATRDVVLVRISANGEASLFVER